MCYYMCNRQYGSYLLDEVDNMAVVYSKKNVRIARKNASEKTLVENGFISEKDVEMDKRARAAVSAAISKLEVKQKPIAKYDAATRKAYLKYPSEGR